MRPRPPTGAGLAQGGRSHHYKKRISPEKKIRIHHLPVIHVLPWPDLEHFDYPVRIVQIENDPVISDALVKIGISFTPFHIPVRILSDGFYLIDDTGSVDF